MDIVLAVLNLLYMFSKRSNFIPRLPFEKKELLIVKLFNIAEVSKVLQEKIHHSSSQMCYYR